MWLTYLFFICEYNVDLHNSYDVAPKIRWYEETVATRSWGSYQQTVSSPQTYWRWRTASHCRRTRELFRCWRQDIDLNLLFFQYFTKTIVKYYHQFIYKWNQLSKQIKLATLPYKWRVIRLLHLSSIKVSERLLKEAASSSSQMVKLVTSPSAWERLSLLMKANTRLWSAIFTVKIQLKCSFMYLVSLILNRFYSHPNELHRSKQ